MDRVGKAISELDEVVAGMADEQYGEYIADALETHIRKREGEARRALELALGAWLSGPDLKRCIWAKTLIVRLRLVEYLSTLRKLREEAMEPNSRFPRYWLELFDHSIRLLEEACNK